MIESSLDLHHNIAELRERAGLKQGELARRLDIDPSIPSLWEHGKRLVPHNRLEALAAALEVTVEQLLEGVAQPLDAIEATLPSRESDAADRAMREASSHSNHADYLNGVLPPLPVVVEPRLVDSRVELDWCTSAHGAVGTDGRPVAPGTRATTPQHPEARRGRHHHGVLAPWGPVASLSDLLAMSRAEHEAGPRPGPEMSPTAASEADAA